MCAKNILIASHCSAKRVALRRVVFWVHYHLIQPDHLKGIKRNVSEYFFRYLNNKAAEIELFPRYRDCEKKQTVASK